MSVDANNMINMPGIGNPEPMQPQAEVMLCSGVLWDRSYAHVRKYNSRNDLDNYLRSHARVINEYSTFVDVGKMAVAIGYNQMVAYHCNYIRWVNKPWDEKPHYGFITKIEPRGTHTCVVSFEPDIWNECQFDMTLRQCFVERQHVKKSSDTIGRWTYPEDLQTGEMIVNGQDHRLQIPTANENGSFTTFFASAYSYNEATGALSTAPVMPYQGVTTGLEYLAPSNPSAFIGALVDQNKIDGLVDAWEMPDVFADSDLVTKVFSMEKPYTSIDGYVPKNNKLFCYPYNYLYMTNNTGQSKNYQYELFKVPGAKNKVQFYYTMNCAPSPTLYCYPSYYKGVELDYGDAITYSNYPKVPVAVDAYRAWLAQNSSNLLVSMTTGKNVPDNPLDWAGRAITTAVDLGATGGLKSTLSGVLNLISGSYHAELQSDGIKGSVGNTLPHSVGFDCISVFPVCIKAEYARIIDEYFSMYGYKICRVKKPNITSRSTWNYIKTQNCTVTGGFEAEVLEKLRAIFDNGVTVWHTDNIGDYSADNL